MIIAIAQQKGGVGKTTTTLNLAVALAIRNRRVLIVDFDPQGNCTLCMGIEPDDLELTVHHVLSGDEKIENVIIKDAKPGIDLLPSNIDLSASEILLSSRMEREKSLSKKLKTISGNYDFVLIDCPPSLGLLTINALAAADKVIIPVSCAFLSLRGLRQLNETLAQVRESINPSLEIAGIVLTQSDKRTIHAQEVIARVHDFYADRVFKSIIPKTVKFDESPVTGLSLIEYDNTSPGAKAYQELAKEVMNG